MKNSSVSSSSGPKRTSFSVERLGPHLGAEIGGIDLGMPISAPALRALHKAFVEHQVLVFRDQNLSQQQYIDFARQFGDLTIHPFATSLPDHPELIVLDNDESSPPLSTDQWHSDEMFREEPPMATVLRATIVPEIGGDTLFASMTAAYDGLNPALQEFYSGLEAVNDFKVFRVLYSGTSEGRSKLVEIEDLFPNTAHPVVRVHPESGRKAIYVAPQTTKFIKGVRDFESDAILAMLYQLPEIPEYQIRVRWEPGMIVIWDNRSTQHYAPRDYLPHRRRMERLTVRGDRPISVLGAPVASAVEMNVRGTDKAAGTGKHRKGLARPANSILEKTR